MQKSKNKVRKRKDDDNLSTPSTSSDEQQQQPNNNNNNALNENSKNNCTHIKKSILDIGKLQKSIYQHSKNRKIKFCVECEKNSTTTNQENENDFEYDETCWLCLKCGIQLCGRARAAHALNHYSTPRSDQHSITVNTTTFEIWCYSCDSELLPSQSKKLESIIDFLKKELNESITTTNNNEQDLKLKPSGNDNVEQLKKDEVLTKPRLNNIQNTIRQTAKVIFHVASNVSNNNTNMVGNAVIEDTLPRVRGLSNLGNTCFFNAVMQCLAQTPYLHHILQTATNIPEVFELPGGKLNLGNDEEILLSPIKGALSQCGNLTLELIKTLEQLQMPGSVFSPKPLFNQLTKEWPQFDGGEQHDSHELLRHLLESVRNEDLKRYKKIILANINYNKNDSEAIMAISSRKCKFYNEQVKDRILLPEQVFRGFLVSTLTCQDCFHTSSRHENFLDISLPINVEKPQPPIRRRANSPEPILLNNNNNNNNDEDDTATAQTSSNSPSKHKLRKEKEKEKKINRAKKHQSKRNRQASNSAVGSDANITGDLTNQNKLEESLTGTKSLSRSVSSSASSNSDADIEDNIMDDTTAAMENDKTIPLMCDTNLNIHNINKNNHVTTTNYDNEVTLDLINLNKTDLNASASSDSGNQGSSPLHDEDLDDMVENSYANLKYDGDFNKNVKWSNSADPLVTSVLSVESETSTGISIPSTNKMSLSSINQSEQINNIYDELAISKEGGQKLLKQLLTPGVTSPSLPITELKQLHLIDNKNSNYNNDDDDDDHCDKETDNKTNYNKKNKRVRTHSHTDWSTTIAPRYQCQEGECSIQSCLNNFTAVEMMTGSNKVDCEACTENCIGNKPNGSKPSGSKSIKTNATKQFLISSPPAVLILHLKRFQVGPRFMFRKLSKHIDFPFILDVAPFCGSKVKNLPNINRQQKKLLYALYGIVEHSGNMHGGHYTAYVKVRPKLKPNDPRWNFIPQGSKVELDQTDEQRVRLEEAINKAQAKERMRRNTTNDTDSDDSTLSSTSDEGACGSSASVNNSGNNDMPLNTDSDVSAPPGKWYYVSDSYVKEASTEDVANAQAYLLFYERIY